MTCPTCAVKDQMITDLVQHCEVDECTTCGTICCPGRDPLHFHHDGCPSCTVGEEGEPKDADPLVAMAMLFELLPMLQTAVVRINDQTLATQLDGMAQRISRLVGPHMVTTG